MIAEANGNSFFVVNRMPLGCSGREIAIKNCRKVDGMLLITSTGKTTRMEIFDKDGTKEAMCGNGLLITAMFTIKKKKVKSGVIGTDDGPKRFRLSGNELEAEIGSIETSGKVLVVAGLRHFVMVVEKELYEDKVLSVRIASQLREALDANISIVTRANGKVFARTFETGVEGFTKACGTGCTAAAHKLGVSEVSTDGGTLRVKRKGGKYFLISDVNAIRIDS